MNRLTLRTALLVFAALTFNACKKEQPPAAGDESAAETEVVAEQAQPPEAAGEEAPLVINEDVVNRYMAMWSQHQELVKQVASEVDQTLKELKEKGELTGTLHALRRAQEIETRLKKDEAKLRREFRFEERDVERLQDFFGQLSSSLQLTRSLPAEKLIADMRAQLQSLPEENRAEAQKEVDQMEADFKAQRELQSLRAQFGDAAVDAALEHEDEILKMQERQLQILKDLP